MTAGIPEIAGVATVECWRWVADGFGADAASFFYDLTDLAADENIMTNCEDGRDRLLRQTGVMDNIILRSDRPAKTSRLVQVSRKGRPKVSASSLRKFGNAFAFRAAREVN